MPEKTEALNSKYKLEKAVHVGLKKAEKLKEEGRYCKKKLISLNESGFEVDRRFSGRHLTFLR